MPGIALNALHTLILLILTHTKMFEIIIVLSSLLYRELREIEVKLLDKGLSVSIWAGIHIQKSSHQSLFFWAQGTTDLKLHSGSKPLLKNKRNPFSLLWVKSMINLFVGQFSNFKFHISLMESNNMELILVWWSNTKEVYTHTHTHTAIPHSAA